MPDAKAATPLDAVPADFVLDTDPLRVLQAIDFDPANPQVVLRGRTKGKGQWKELAVKLVETP